MKLNIGDRIFNLCERLWPITRSITGDGVRETLGIIKQEIPNLIIHEMPTGTKCFDWEIPKEWNIESAYIIDPNGRKIVDFQNNNLHVVGYSIPVNNTVSLSELQKHLYSKPDLPDSIPYVTSYYKEEWGFCLSENQRNTLKEGFYQVYIDSRLENGSLTYGEIVIPGKSDKEVFFSTYICHPSMANNELSGPTVVTYLAKWIKSQMFEYTYRIIFIPETIGSICYLSKNIKTMKKNIVAGYNVTCVGDNNSFSFLPSRDEDTLSDKIALHILKHEHTNFIKYSFLDRGSDERQYCSPGVDLPISSIMRTKYGEYKEYHTSLDNLDYISSTGLNESYIIFTKCIKCIEFNKIYKTTVLCEPQMGRRNLYPSLGSGTTLPEGTKIMKNILAYADGKKDLLSISEKLGVYLLDIVPIINTLVKEGLLEMVE